MSFALEQMKGLSVEISHLLIIEKSFFITDKYKPESLLWAQGPALSGPLSAPSDFIPYDFPPHLLPSKHKVLI